MAVATPVLERQTQQTEEEIRHNARIKDRYARLINPDCKIGDIIEERAFVSEKPAEPAIAPAEAKSYVAPVAAPAKPYLVENARADAAIFRADNPVNQRARIVEVKASDDAEEEENDDLRPTDTTIQYRTLGESDKKNDIKIVTDSRERAFGKREKIIIATFISVVIALFALVIINSAIIAGLNSEISSVQGNIAAANAELKSVMQEYDAIASEENIADFAESHNLVK